MSGGWVDSLLSRWGRWAVKRESSSLGFSSRSPMFRDVRPGRGWSRETVGGFTPADIISCDEAVKTLPLILRVVVIHHYQRCVSVQKTAEVCGVSRKTVSQYLNQAQEMVMTAMSAE